MPERWRAVIWLDRDGTVLDDPGYLNDPTNLVVLPGAATAIARANAASVAVVMVTNQSGVGRGLFDLAALERIHAEMRHQLAASAGARLDAIQICPHRPGEQCRCRKPRPGMVEQALLDPALAGLPSAAIGDKSADVGLAHAVGALAILVRTGEGTQTERELRESGTRIDHVADDLGGAIDWFLGRLEVA